MPKDNPGALTGDTIVQMFRPQEGVADIFPVGQIFRGQEWPAMAPCRAPKPPWRQAGQEQPCENTSTRAMAAAP